MTGPVERVPLTDQQLDEIAERAEWPAGKDWAQRALQDRDDLLAELRAARAREQELRIHCAGLEASLVERVLERDRRQQRIDKALALCDQMDARPEMSGFVLTDRVRAALTGTETTNE